MTFKYGERVQESSTSTGTGDMVLAGVPDASYESFASVFSNGDTTDIAIFGNGQFEMCRATYNTGANSLTRGAIYASSNGGSAVNFNAGTKTVISSAPGSLIDDLILGTIVGPFTLSGVISPSQITANQNDYNPTNLSTASVLRLNTDASRNITGLQGGSTGRMMLVSNVGSFNIVLKTEDAGSSAANRFLFTGDITILPNEMLWLRYDGTSSRWRGGGWVAISAAAESWGNWT